MEGRIKFKFIDTNLLQSYYSTEISSALSELSSLAHIFIIFKTYSQFKHITRIRENIFIDEITDMYNNITFCTVTVLQHFLNSLQDSPIIVYFFDEAGIPIIDSLQNSKIEFILTNTQIVTAKTNYAEYLNSHREILKLIEFKNRAIFNIRYRNRKNAIFLNRITTPHGDVLFPDAEKLISDHLELVESIYEASHKPPCPFCGCRQYIGSKKKCYCQIYPDILEHLPSDPPQELMDIILTGMGNDNTHNFARNLNANLRASTFYASIHSGTPVQFSRITGVPYALSKDFTVGNAYMVSDNTNFEAKFNISTEVVRDAARILLRNNEILREYITEEEIVTRERGKPAMSVYVPGNSNPVSLVQLGSSTVQSRPMETFAHPHSANGKKIHINSRSFLYDVLSYPLVFHDGKSGFGKFPDDRIGGVTTLLRGCLLTLIHKPPDHWIHRLGYLREELICMTYGRILDRNIDYLLRNPQTLIRQDERQFYAQDENQIEENPADEDGDALIEDDWEEAPTLEYGERTFVPPSMTGSPSHLRSFAHRAYILSSRRGPPTVFGTITMNPYHASCVANIKSTDYGQNSAVISDTFHAEYNRLLQYIKEKEIFGVVDGEVIRMEYQQRGLPHIHFLYWTDLDMDDMSEIDKRFCAELPRIPNEVADMQFFKDFREIVKRYQTHKHSSRCTKGNGRCCYNYPQQICPETVRVGNRIYLCRRNREDLEIVPYNPEVLWLWRGHIDIEPVASETIIGYVLKYVTKPSDVVDAYLVSHNESTTTTNSDESQQTDNQPNQNQTAQDSQSQSDNSQTSTTSNSQTTTNAESNESTSNKEEDSINKRREKDPNYTKYKFRGLYVHKEDQLRLFGGSVINSAVQCMNLLNQFQEVTIHPSVKELKIHMEGKKVLRKRRQPDGTTQLKNGTSDLEYYFLRPSDPIFDDITFIEYTEKYIPHQSPLKNENRTYYMDNANPPRYIYPRTDSNEFIAEIQSVMPSKIELFWLRQLLKAFPARGYKDLLTVNGELHSSFYVAAKERGLTDSIDEYYNVMADAVVLNHTPSDLRYLACLLVKEGAGPDRVVEPFMDALSRDCSNIAEFERRMIEVGRRVHVDLGMFSFSTPIDSVETDVEAETEIASSQGADSDPLSTLSISQRMISQKIIDAVLNTEDGPQLMFLQGRAGTGKTYTVRTIIQHLRSIGKKVIVSASTGIAASQYEGGQTFHSLFKLGIDDGVVDRGQGFVSGIGKDTKAAKILTDCDLIVVDECSMLTVDVTERASLTLQHLLSNYNPFGGVKFLFVGDFLQLPPVAKSGSSHSQIILFAPWWTRVVPFALHQQMRTTNITWSKTLIEIANGTSSDNMTWMRVPYGLITKDFKEAQNFLIDGLEPNGRFPLDRMWIVSTNKYVDIVNWQFDRWRENVPVLGKVFSFNELMPLEEQRLIDDGNAPENQNNPAFIDLAFAHTLINNYRNPDVPEPVIEFRRDDVFIIMRNINTPEGIVKGARCHIIDLSPNGRVVKIELQNGNTFLLPRIRFPIFAYGVNFHRLQIPLRKAYAGTVHRSQGMTLDRTVIDLRSHMWDHGQMYVALSRVRDPRNMCILLPLSESFTGKVPTKTFMDVSDYIQKLEEYTKTSVSAFQDPTISPRYSPPEHFVSSAFVSDCDDEILDERDPIITMDLKPLIYDNQRLVILELIFRLDAYEQLMHLIHVEQPADDFPKYLNKLYVQWQNGTSPNCSLLVELLEDTADSPIDDFADILSIISDLDGFYSPFNCRVAVKYMDTDTQTLSVSEELPINGPIPIALQNPNDSLDDMVHNFIFGLIHQGLWPESSSQEAFMAEAFITKFPEMLAFGFIHTMFDDDLEYSCKLTEQISFSRNYKNISYDLFGALFSDSVANSLILYLSIDGRFYEFSEGKSKLSSINEIFDKSAPQYRLQIAFYKAPKNSKETRKQMKLKYSTPANDTPFCGLLNESAHVCHLNSLLQCFYGSVYFRNMVSLKVNSNMHAQKVQLLFRRMDLSRTPLSPKDIVTSFGFDLNESEDVTESLLRFLHVLFPSYSPTEFRISYIPFEDSRGNQRYDQPVIQSFRYLAPVIYAGDSMQELVNAHFVDEHVETVEQNRRIVISRHVKLQNYPELLIVAPVRYEYDRTTGLVSMNLNQIPYDDTLLLPSTSNTNREGVFDNERCQYKLFAVIYGKSNGQDGHYIAYRKYNDVWYEFNDSIVKARDPRSIHENETPSDMRSFVFFYSRVLFPRNE